MACFWREMGDVFVGSMCIECLITDCLIKKALDIIDGFASEIGKAKSRIMRP
jgi:hypothetical protein